MIKLHKKVVSGVLVELAVFGGVFQCKGIAAQAEGKVLQEERYKGFWISVAISLLFLVRKLFTHGLLLSGLE